MEISLSLMVMAGGRHRVLQDPANVACHPSNLRTMAAVLLLRFMAVALLATTCGVLSRSVMAFDNPIVVENAKIGNPASEWDVANPGEISILGFTTDISYNKGQSVRFKVSTDAPSNTINIYRVGFYGGNGARKVATVLGQSKVQPDCLRAADSGLVDCGNWSVTATWAIPANATSGVYLAKLIRSDNGAASHAVFVVRDDASHSDVLVQTSDTTWQAYNSFGGNSLYSGEPAGRAYKVSYNRPFLWRVGGSYSGISNPFHDEFAMIRWIEANGYDVTYFSGVDTDRFGSLIENHKAFLSVGHDEYWSQAQRANVEAALANGVNLAFFSGNEVFWKVRWENSIDGQDTPYRTLPVCFKETHANDVIDPEDPPTWTGTWRDPRFSPPGDGGRPENALTGTIFTVNGVAVNDLTVTGDYGRMRFWRNTGLASLPLTSTAILGKSVLGYEWDEDVDNGFRPRGLIRLSSTTADVAGHLVDFGSSYAPGSATHNLTLYRHPSGALVFGAGTVQWSWGLDAHHDNNINAPVSGPDSRIQQATVNLFADMGVQPGSLQSPLVPATATTDAQPPVSTIASPLDGDAVESGTIVAITGTASDVGSGVVGGVEVSVDGTTWHPAVGRENWSYAWVPSQTGPATIRVVAVDDSGNLASTVSSATVQVVAPSPGSSHKRIWSNANVPAVPSANDSNPVELGFKFISDVAGSVTGIYFYKGIGNDGPHFGHLWKGDGTLLATATFTTETPSGWQYKAFASPVAINANTTYVASYHTETGHYAFSSGAFATGVDAAPLHALRDGVDGPNGVYAYGGAGFPLFPSSSYQSANYWVDIGFAPAVPEPPQAQLTTIWSSSVVPGWISVPDSNPVELGTKFRTDRNGLISALRYYKSAENTGTHLGHLWRGDGTLLASATFDDATAVGWQQADLATPVAITANTDYVVSYHTETGYYSANVGYFASGGIDNPPLYALGNGVSGPNGLYRYGASGFPTQSYNSTNYWVDVVFQDSAAALLSARLAAPTAAGAQSKIAKKEAKPRKLSKLKYAKSAWRGENDEAWNPLKPGARGLLNGGKLISPEGR